VPAAQLVQVDAPIAENVPAGQDKHALEAASEYLPEAHDEHWSDRPTADWVPIVPAAQEEHVVDAVDTWKNPAAQAVQVARPEVAE